MFTLLFVAAFELSLWCLGIYVGYRLLFYKSIKEKKALKLNKEKAEKMALVILKSSSNKEVQAFMTENVSFLSKETFNKLNEHLDYLNVLSEEPLKARFDNLDVNVEEDLIEDNQEPYRNKA